MKCAAHHKKFAAFFIEEFGMEKKLIAIALSCSIFQLQYSMDKSVAFSFKDALTGTKRNIAEEIKAVEASTTLTDAAKARQLGKLYGELRNKFRGKDEYSQYNELMCTYSTKADELEKEDARIAELHAQQKAREVKEVQLLEKINAIKQDVLRDNLAGCSEIIRYYSQLKSLFEDVNKEKYNLYEARHNNLEKKKIFFTLQELCEKETDKSQKAKIKREMSEFCPKKDRAQKLNDEADALEKEVEYNQLIQKAAESSNLSQKAKLHRVMMYYSEADAEKNLVLAKDFEAQAEKQQQEQLIIVDKTCKIVGLNMEISAIDANKTLTPYNRLKTLSQLMEQRLKLAQDVPKFKSDFAQDERRIQILRREAIGYARSETERKEMIALLKY